MNLEPNHLYTLLAHLTDRIQINITLSLTPPTPPPPPTPTTPHTSTHDTKASYTLLADAGVNGQALIELATRFPPERIRQVLQAIDASDKPATNRPGYVRSALEHGYYQNWTPNHTKGYPPQ